MMVVDSITFEGTKNRDLLINELPAYLAGPVADIDELVRQTTAYRSYYERNREGNHGNGDAYNETSPSSSTSQVAKVVLIRGSPVHHANTTNMTQTQVQTQTLPTNNGLVGTVLTAYNLHQNLQFRPDDLWITILAQFSAYVNGRAEELRDKIVSHNGTKTLEVTVVGESIHTVDFGAIHRMFLDKISEHIKDETLREWFLPGFSTTTDTDELCASAMAMCSFQAYFAYKSHLICGIPEITLLGVVDDWKLLRDKVERLVEFDGQDQILSNEWVPRLRTILDHFVESAEHGSSRNLDFWHHIVSHTGYGCAGPDFLTGWITTFSVFNQNGELYAKVTPGSWPILGIKDIYHNVASCPSKIDDNGRQYNATLFVGQMAYDYELDVTRAFPNLAPAVQTSGNENATMRILKPRNDWALAIEEGFVTLPKVTFSPDPHDATYLAGYCPGKREFGVLEASPIQDSAYNELVCGTGQPIYIVPLVAATIFLMAGVAAAIVLKRAWRIPKPSSDQSTGTVKDIVDTDTDMS